MISSVTSLFLYRSSYRLLSPGNNETFAVYWPGQQPFPSETALELQEVSCQGWACKKHIIERNACMFGTYVEHHPDLIWLLWVEHSKASSGAASAW